MEEISHSGVISSIRKDLIEVQIVSQSACGSCKAAGLCSSAEAVRKMVQVRNFAGQNYVVGEEVDVVLAKSMGGKAVLLAYVVPLFVLLLTVVPLSFLGVDELLTAVGGVVGVALWYLIVYLAGAKLSGEYNFYIRKK